MRHFITKLVTILTKKEKSNMSISFKEPKEVVTAFIGQACELNDRHSPRINEMRSTNNPYDELIRAYRLEHKKLCEQFGFNITKHNFSETSYHSPSTYENYVVAKVEKLSPQKVKVFTRIPRKRIPPMIIFYLELQEGQWKIIKVRELRGDKEFSVWCW
jgi:hypothetical protein